MASQLVLLPPSEGKSEGGRRGTAPDRFAAELGKPRLDVLEALSKSMASTNESEQSKLLRVRGELFSRAVIATQRLLDGSAPLLPAWKRYSGVVWEALDPGTLSPTVRARILVPSALYGITSAQDHIADYRLGMQASLPGIGNLARFWRPVLAEAIRPRRRGTVVIDLLTNEHRSAIEWQELGPVVRVDFVQAHGRGAAGHFAKAAKGLFARHVIDNGIDDALSFANKEWMVVRTDYGFQVRATS